MLRRALPLSALAAAVPAVLVGCPHEPPPARAPAAEAPSAPAPPAPRGLSYVLADPDALPKGSVLALDGDALGVLIDGVRVIVRGSEVQVIPGVLPGRATQVERLPAFLGGGHLFRAREGLLFASSFDGPVRPVAGFPEAISRLSFGPRGALVRAHDGHRWWIELPSGAPAPLPVPGLADIAALADGRAAALAEGGRLFVSTDRGARWNEMTASLVGVPSQLVTHGQGIWIKDDSGHAYQVEVGGAVREVDKVPAAPPARFRAREPGWHGADAPLRVAARRGALLDDGTAIVVDSGNVDRVDLRTGAVRVLAAGRLPPELTCEALRAGDDVIAVCTGHHRGPSLVASRLLSGSPQVERTFPSSGPYFASDDGALVYGASCDGTVLRGAACARDRQGQWTDHGVPLGPDGGAPPPLPGDAGAPPAPKSIHRWVPREGQAPLGLFTDPAPGVYDPGSGAVVKWQMGEASNIPSEISRTVLTDARTTLDRRWTSLPSGELRGWMENGAAVTIGRGGEVSRTAWSFPRAEASGPVAFAQEGSGRLFQSIDRGESWTEVVTLPFTPQARRHSPLRCTEVGCDLSTWLRIGWDPTPPPAVAQEDPPPPAALPRIPRAPLRELVCKPLQESERLQRLPPGVPDEEAGFGARRLPPSSPAGNATTSYRRRFFSRQLHHPAAGRNGSDVERGVRALWHGWGAEFSGQADPKKPLGGITIFGPQRGPEAFKRQLDFVEPFAPEGPVRTVTFAVRELTEASKLLGVPPAVAFVPEGPTFEGLVPVLPADPAGLTGVTFAFSTDQGQAVLTVPGGASPRLVLAGARISPTSASIVSAVELPGGEVGLLLHSSEGDVEVHTAGPGGVALLHALPSLRSTVTPVPANPDALAVGPGGALAVIRAPSGSEPPSERDPALLFPFGGRPPVILAPWSTLTAADDPACRGDDGYRAVVQTAAPWLRLRPGPIGHNEPIAAMLARVRWSEKRVCLEAVELPEGTRTTRSGDDLETAVVARFTGKPAAARVGVGPGTEARQPLSCALAPR